MPTEGRDLRAEPSEEARAAAAALWAGMALTTKEALEALAGFYAQARLVRQDELEEAYALGQSCRDLDWWDALGGTPGVDATPEACKRWQMQLQELAAQEAREAGRREEREEIVELAVCEIEHVILTPGTYRFVQKVGCGQCAAYLNPARRSR